MYLNTSTNAIPQSDTLMMMIFVVIVFVACYLIIKDDFE